jgi:hypothetical protein
MAFIANKEELKPRSIIFRRSDVQHHNWYCRVKLPKADRYKTDSLKKFGYQCGAECRTVRTRGTSFILPIGNRKDGSDDQGRTRCSAQAQGTPPR